MMSLIYKNASRTIVWFGETELGNAKSSFGLICEIVNAWSGKNGAFFCKMGSRRAATNQLSNSDYRIFLEEYGDSWHAVIELFRLSWWTQKWVIQDVTSSRSVHAMWQDCDISWYCIGLVAAITEAQEAGGQGMLSTMLRNSQMNSRKEISHAYLMLRMCQWGNLKPVHTSFLQHLRLTMGLTLEIRGILFFALLGIRTKDHDPEGRPLFRADYGLTTQEVNKSLTERLLAAESTLDFLADAQCLRKFSEELDNNRCGEHHPFATILHDT